MSESYQYSYIPETKEDLDWADLTTIDLATYDAPGGKEKLAKELLDAVNTKGFFYLTNFGISQDRIDRQFGIGSRFYQTPLEERMKSKSDIEHGNSNGYRPAGRHSVGGGLRDRTEEYNVPIHDDPGVKHPKVIQDALPEIKEFERDLHSKVLSRIYQLIALGLEIPSDKVKPLHEYESGSYGILRYMRYSPFSEEELSRFDTQLYGKGHTDSCAVTLLFRQPIAALQIKDPQSGTWKWVKPMDNAVTVNAGDCLSILTGNYIRSTIHRVNIPPPDQRHYERLGVIYFCRPPREMLLGTLDSPVLKQAGCGKNGFEVEGHTVPTAAEFQIQKEHWQSNPSAGKSGAEIIPGFRAMIHA